MCVPAPAFAALRGATARPVFLGSSMAEHPAVNRRVAGSSPARGAKSILLIGYKPDSYRVYSVASRVARNFPPRRGSINSSSAASSKKGYAHAPTRLSRGDRSHVHGLRRLRRSGRTDADAPGWGVSLERDE